MALISLIGCAPANLDRFAADEARAGQVSAALAVADEERRVGRDLPEYPPGCRTRYRSGVVAADRLDAALIKTDRALARANKQIGWCAAWFDDWKNGVAE